MEISDWRKRIDELDRKLVAFLSQRAQAAHEIGKLKRGIGVPIYEPDREQAVFSKVRSANPGPLPDHDLLNIIQQEEMAPNRAVAKRAGDTELDSEVND